MTLVFLEPLILFITHGLQTQYSMKEYIQFLIQKKGLRFSLILILLLVCLNAVLVIYYRNVIDENSDLSEDIQLVKNHLNTMDKNINLADMGVRAYIIKQTDQLLDPYIIAKNDYLVNLDSLESGLVKIGYDVSNMVAARIAIIDYMKTCELMVDLCKGGKIDEAFGVFEQDRGLTAWQRYAPFIEDSNSYVAALSAENSKEFKNSMNFILMVQFFLIILAVPILTIVYRKIVKDDKFKSKVFKRIDDSNRQYLFDNGDNVEDQDEDTIIQKLENNLKKTAGFIKSITQGNYDIDWEGMHDKVIDLNKANIAGELIMMRDQMQKVKGEDEIRIWTNEGLSQFGDLIRKYQNDKGQLSEKIISEIVKYLGAEQGGLFFVSEDEQKTRFLELVGCYAYQRKKYQEKRIEIGQGMVGQCFLEGETTHISNIPEDYVNITSGLGETNPTNLLIVPLKINEEIVGVLELAKLKKFESYQIEFVERLAESVASSISAVNANESTRILLEQSQQQSEEMRAQEEEMRQNMEELQATQEQIYRKNEEVEELLKKTSENEEAIKSQNEIILAEKKALEKEDAILGTLMKMIPDRVTVKDQDGTYLKVSESKFKSLKEKGFSEVIGKSDKEMFGQEHFEQSFSVEKEIMTSQKSSLNIEEKIQISEKESIWGSTSRVPLWDKNGEVMGTVVITRDITREKEYFEELKKLKNEK